MFRVNCFVEMMEMEGTEPWAQLDWDLSDGLISYHAPTGDVPPGRPPLQQQRTPLTLGPYIRETEYTLFYCL